MNRDEATTAAVRLILDGYSRLDILQYLRTKTPENPNPPRTPAQKIYADALERIRDLPPATNEQRLALCQEITRALLEKMIAAGDFDGALRAEKELARLFDAYALAREERIGGQGEARPPAEDTGPPLEAGNVHDLTGLLAELREAGDA